MKIKLTILIGFLTFFTCKAQVLENKLNVYIGYNSGKFSGNKLSNENGFIFPLLYSNMADLTGYSAKTTWKISPLLGIGLEGSQMAGSGWALENYNIYEGAEVIMYSISPVFQFHTRFKNTGISNRLKLFCEASPVYGQSVLQLKYPIFEIQPQGNTFNGLTESIDSYFGAKGGAGIEFSFAKHSGMYIQYSIQQNFVSSAIHTDDKFTSSHVSFGMFFRFIKNKRYNY